LRKTAIAVVVGFVVWTVMFLGSNSAISMVMPASFNADGSTDSVAILLLILALSVVASVVSGGLTAQRAGADAARTAGIALGVLLLAVGVFVQLQFWEQMPIWYHLLFLGALIPGVMAGVSWSKPAQPVS
jgi:hypothetical protein